MKLTKDEVLHIAKLSRLTLTDTEVELFSNQLSSVLEYVNALSKVDVEGVEETSQVTGLENVFRDETVRPFDRMHDLVQQAAETEDNQVKVKNVL